jgi:hypothetical protein
LPITFACGGELTFGSLRRRNVPSRVSTRKKSPVAMTSLGAGTIACPFSGGFNGATLPGAATVCAS